MALKASKAATVLSIARDPVDPVPNTDRHKVSRGAYTFIDDPSDYQLTVAGAGSNLHYAAAAGESLARQGIEVRIVSAPSLDIFELQDEDDKESVLPRDGKPVISVEEYIASRLSIQEPYWELM